jgi:hypothetical protein
MCAYRTENTIPLFFPGHCLETAAVQSSISRAPPSDGSTCHNNLLQLYRIFYDYCAMLSLFRAICGIYFLGVKEIDRLIFPTTCQTYMAGNFILMCHCGI